MQKVCLFENGELKFMPQNECKIAADDAGANFGDGVYEVVAYANSQFVDLEAHMARLKNSLAGVEISLPENFVTNQIIQALEKLVKENASDEGYVYFRITRGINNFVTSKLLKPPQVFSPNGTA